MGDSSDNIPGVAGVGEKTARFCWQNTILWTEYNEHIDEIKGKVQEKLIANKDMAYLSYDLATINVNSPIDFDNLDAAKFTPVFSQEVKKIS